MSDQSYPGTAALSADVKQRVISTFLHTLQLARQGSNEEANVGCEFILKLDPMFEPARQLVDQMGNPFVMIDYDDLEQQVAGALPVSSGDPLTDARAALAARDFHRAAEITSALLREDLMNTEAQEIAEQAQSRLEAEPFVEQFTKTARAKIAADNLSGASADLAKARQLDDGHPQVLELELLLGQAMPAATPAFSTPATEQSFDVGAGFGSPFGGGFGEAAAPDAFSSNAPQSYSFETPSAAPPAAEQTYGFGTPVDSSSSGFGSETPSFVVDAAPGGAAPAAAEFGFTFEEEQKADSGFPAMPDAGYSSFDSLSRSESNTFDFTTASVDTSPEDQQQIARFLSDGDELFDAGEFQRAIDTWSKIFLIDVTNDDASQRIERARLKRLESDRQVEELLVAGTLAFEKNDHTTARAKFEQVLKLDPNHFNAREYLDRIETGGGGAIVPPPPSPTATRLDDFDDDFADPSFAPAVPPSDTASSNITPSKKTTTKKTTAAVTKKSPMVPLAIVAALVILAGAGYFAYSKLFTPAAETNPAETAQIFTRAQELAKSGKYDQAITALSAIEPSDPEHDRALETIADLKNQKAQSAGMINGRPAAEVFAGLITQGTASFQARDYLTAKQVFDQASTIQALPADAKQMHEASALQVGKLETAMLLLKDSRYDEGVANLEALQRQDPGNVAVRTLLHKAHFNAGATSMQQGQTDAAVAAFEKVLAIDPNDTAAKRSRDLAARYDGKTKDLLYRIYVKYLPLQSF